MIPTLSGWPLLKRIPALLRAPLPELLSISRQYPGSFWVKAARGQEVLVINDPAHVRHILKSQHERYSRRPAIRALEPLLGEGLLMAEDDWWEKQNALLRPAFRLKQVGQYEAVIIEETEALVRRWQPVAHTSGIVEVETDLYLLMLRIMLRTQFCLPHGLDLPGIIHALHTVLEAVSFTQQKLDWLKKKVLLKAKPSARAVKAMQVLENAASSIIATAEAQPNETGYVLHLLLEACERGDIPKKQVRDELMNFLFAGYDTVAAGLSWTLYALACHPQEAQKLREEYRDALPTVSTLAQFPYTKAVVQEGLRLYPPVWGFHRVAVTNDILDGAPIPRGTYVMISPFILHRHPQYWPSPDEFMPERFVSTNQSEAFTYIPFGQGKRICLGNHLAMVEMQMILPRLLQELHWQPLSPRHPRIRPGIIIKGWQPLRLRVRES